MGSGAAASATANGLASRGATDPEKEFKCPTCARIFNKKANLKVHSRKHTGERPYACSKPGCGRVFMWKSSVTFHEQNCPSMKRSGVVGEAGIVTKGVQKRPKAASGGVKKKGKLGVKEERLEAEQVHVNHPVGGRGILVPGRDLMADQRDLPASARDVSGGVRDVVGRGRDINGEILGGGKDIVPPARDMLGGVREPLPLARRDLLPGGSAVSKVYSPPPVYPLFGDSPVSKVYSPPPVYTLFADTPDPASALPAPSTLLDKRVSGGGKPPMIPGVRGLYSLPKEGTGGKVLFDLRVPASTGSSKVVGMTGAMFGAMKMPKMPIAMELDDSDEEGCDKIVGAQDAFMRTGDPFGGFAPPTRCSPLPISSPIVCPGISPMPLSPLAPFSPLPPDSPAHNAPNPVHPPLNQTNVRPNTPGATTPGNW